MVVPAHLEQKSQAALDLATGSLARVPVRVTNRGRLTWDSHADPPIKLAYHWLQPSEPTGEPSGRPELTGDGAQRDDGDDPA